MTLEEKRLAMEALLHLIEAERILRGKVPKVRDENPELWQAQIEGVKAERNNPGWQPKKQLTLGALIPMLSPYKGLNKALNFLPHYPAEYDKLIAIRNAIGHGDWEELTSLGGGQAALQWASSFYGLVVTCEDPIASAMLQLKLEWPWPH